MGAYLLQLVNNKITVSEYENGTFTVLKNRGEKEQPYDEANFWLWFKQKIEYQDEKLSFVVVTDIKDFTIPEYSEIQIDKTNYFDNNCDIDDLLLSVSQGLFVLSFPQRIISEPKSRKEPQKPKPKIEETPNENAIVDYFRQRTQEFKN